VHRFYTGYIGIGIAQLLTFGGCGIWQLIDLIAIFRGTYADASGRSLTTE
jgi:TM2 domain-containing membrane protein YozV